MALFKNAMKNVRKYGGNILKFFGLGAGIGTAVAVSDDVKDYMTAGVIGLILLLILGRK